MASVSSASEEPQLGQCFIHRRHPSFVASLNVRTAKSIAKLAETSVMLKDKNIDVCCLQEMRWNGKGIIELEYYNCYYSGEGQHHGVGIMVRKELCGLVKKWVVDAELSSRIIMMKIGSINIASVYAPTESSYNMEEKEKFYIRLKATLKKFAKRIPTLILGDFNARIASAESGHPSIGNFITKSIQRTNDNGSLMLEFALENSMVIANSYFRHNYNKKYTWTHAKGAKAELDYILINKNWKQLITNVIVKDPIVKTDHRLLIATTRLKFSEPRKSRPSSSKLLLSDDIRNQLKDEDRYLEFDELNCVEDKWEKLKDAVTIDHPTPQPKEPLADKLLSDNRNVTPAETMEKLWNERANDLRNASETGNSRVFYSLLRKAVGYKHRSKDIPCKDIIAQIKETSGEFVENLDPTQQKIVEYREKEANEGLVAPPTFDEVYYAAKSLSNNKCSGNDGIPAEVWKEEVPCKKLHELIVSIWDDKLPEEWKIGNVIALPKPKGGFRTIALQSSAYKVYAKVVQTRIRDHVKVFVTPTQNGFVAGRSTVDAIYRADRYREKAVEYDEKIKLVLLDFSKAFDKIKHSAMIEAFEQMDMPVGYRWRILEIVRRCKMKCKNGACIETANGTRQGCCLSPTLFICVMALLTRQLNCVHIEYADDLCVVVPVSEDVQELISTTKSVSEPLGLILNESKTEVFEASRESWKRGESVNYLGLRIGNNRQCVQERLSKANSVYGQLYHKLFKPTVPVSLRTKINVLFTTSVSVLLYGIQCLALSEIDVKRLDTFVYRKIRTMLGYQYDAHVSYRELSDRLQSMNCKIKWPSETYKRQRVKNFGHQVRHQHELTGQAIVQDHWKRPRGRPPLDMEQVIAKDTGIPKKQITSLAQQRNEWRQHVDADRLKRVI